MKAAVIGCGAWGTALANCLCKNGFETVLWCHDEALAKEMLRKGENPMLEGVALAPALTTSASAECVKGCDLVVIATSSVFVRSSSRMVAPFLEKDVVVATVVKGVESGTMLRMSQIVEEETGHTVVALTGPATLRKLAEKCLPAVWLLVLIWKRRCSYKVPFVMMYFAFTPATILWAQSLAAR